MDILTHTLSGIAMGTVISNFSKNGFKEKLVIVSVSGIAAFLPDTDAISLWSGFDSTIGNLFNLSHSGKEIYSAKFWYSHHAFMHSILAAFVFAFIIGGFKYLIDSRFKKLKFTGLTESLKKNNLIIIGFIVGFLIHLIEDMPTPASTWGGVRLFFPFKVYIGGTGDIWWWNNYDIFINVVCVILLNLLLIGINKFIKLNLKMLTVGVFVVGLTIATIQIQTRKYDFSYSGYTNNYQGFETKSKLIQKEILGDRLYCLMQHIDNKLKISF